MEWFVSPATQGFYPAADQAFYEKCGTWPDDAIAITAEKRLQLRQELQSGGKEISVDASGNPVTVDMPLPPASTRRTKAKAGIDAAAGSARSRFITTVPGQESTYQLKAEEANAYIAANRPADTTAYPMLSAEAEGRGMVVSDLADEILATRTKWVQAAAQIEKARVSGKAAVDGAPDDSNFDAIAKPYIDALNAMKP